MERERSYIYTHDSVDMNMEDLNAYCKERCRYFNYRPIDKVNVTGKYNSSHEKLGKYIDRLRDCQKTRCICNRFISSFSGSTW